MNTRIAVAATAAALVLAAGGYAVYNFGMSQGMKMSSAAPAEGKAGSSGRKILFVGIHATHVLSSPHPTKRGDGEQGGYQPEPDTSRGERGGETGTVRGRRRAHRGHAAQENVEVDRPVLPS